MGNGACGWWSWITHGASAGADPNWPSQQELEGVVDGLLRLPSQVKKKVGAALYWIREPRNLVMDFYQNDLLSIYSGYWNAFECLVEAINILRPQQKLSKTEKQQRIDDFVSKRSGKLTANDIRECYQEIVNPGLVGKASHALRECFGPDAELYITECFRLPDKRQRLYDIRNSINHGEVDAENPEELHRIESRLVRLWLIVWRMFGCLVPFQAPIDSNESVLKPTENDTNPATSV